MELNFYQELLQEQRSTVSTSAPHPSRAPHNCYSTSIKIHPPDMYGALDLPLFFSKGKRQDTEQNVWRSIPPHLLKRRLLNHQFKTSLLLLRRAGGEGMVIKASFCPHPPPPKVVVSIRYLNRLNFK